MNKIEAKKSYLKPSVALVHVEAMSMICTSVEPNTIVKEDFEDGGEHKAENVEW
ncbi:hypothetical protein [Prevotella jejuni]|uniref:hypothetical protein n=1 Tax=Prevotella jejuni TaxID=1177574 RepID=UPI001BA4E5CB|nr:hypothetical protein [Prevotella jejuni]QUB82355.1 hypothetical protein J5A63_09080 [Prevotella jejuni]